MKSFLLALLVILNLILQATIFPSLSIGGVKPDLLLIFVIFSALLDGPKTGIKAGLLIGLLQDLACGKFLGLYTLSKLGTGFVVGLIETRIFKENYLVPVVVLFFGTVLHEFLYMFLAQLVGQSVEFAAGWWTLVLPLALYHAVLGPFLYVPAYKAYVKWWRE